MVLINLFRAAVILLGMWMLGTLCNLFNPTGFVLLFVTSIIIFVTLMVLDLGEMVIIDYFDDLDT